jgi:N-acetylglucosaminyldiphosphoundecaprenol N-acetyl-beta-D-mannosaminyltransferase
MLEPTLEQQLVHEQWSGPCELCASSRDLVSVNGVSFDVLTVDAASATIHRFVDCGNSHVVHFLAVHPTAVARQVPQYRRLLDSGDLVVSDGAPIALTMRAKGRRARQVTGTDAMIRTCEDGLSRATKHYFVGGANQQVADALRLTLLRSFPGIDIVGFEVPPFRPYDHDELVALASDIKSSGADIVWVGLGVPKQDVLAHRLRVLGAAPAIAGVGAAFDMMAGTKRRAPKLVRAVGLEWVFRMMLEPRRLWRRYLEGNAGFVLGVLGESLRRS